jgi:hypothetical protein
VGDGARGLRGRVGQIQQKQKENNTNVLRLATIYKKELLKIRENILVCC